MGMRMEVIDHEFKRHGVINEYSMVQYTPKYNDVGSFQLSCALNAENIDLMREDRILWIEDKYAGVIQYISKSSDSEITVKGYLLSGMTKWRVVSATYEAYKDVHEIYRDLVTDGMITGDRAIPGVTYLSSVLSSEKIRFQSTGSQLADTFKTLGETYDYGFDIFLNMKKKSFDFTLYRGKDRTVGNKSGNKPVIFGTDFNNILSGSYVGNTQEYRNFAYVAGEGEGADRVVVEISSQKPQTGYFRREAYIDARDLQKNGSEQPLTDEEYKELLQQRGLSSLSEYKKVESYEAELRTDRDSAFKYGVDYGLGDTVSIIDKTLGVIIPAKVTAATITFADDGYTIEPTFGFGLPTLYEKLKKGVL